MRKITLALLLALASITMVAQSSTKPIKPTKTIKTTKSAESTKSAKSSFTKMFSSDSITLYLGDTVEIENGHDEKVKVYFNASVPRTFWNDYVAKNNNLEKAVFRLLAFQISLKAQYSLKNADSFEPFKKQFFNYNETENAFTSSYKMMGRNGYGNMIESQYMVILEAK